MTISRPGLTPIHTFPEGVEVVSMIQFRDRILVATSTGIWRLNDEMTALEPLEIVWSDAQ